MREAGLRVSRTHSAELFTTAQPLVIIALTLFYAFPYKITHSDSREEFK